MYSKLPHCSCIFQVLIKCCTQIFAPTIGLEYLDCGAVPLRDGLGFEQLVGLKSLVLCVQEVHYCVPHCVIHEGGEAFSSLAC